MLLNLRNCYIIEEDGRMVNRDLFLAKCHFDYLLCRVRIERHRIESIESIECIECIECIERFVGSRWQEIPSRERESLFKTQKQPQRSSHENQVLRQTPLHNRFSIMETMHAEETMNDTDIISEEDNAGNNQRLSEGTQQKKQKKKKTTTMIVGDSIVKFLDGKQMHRSLQRSQNVLVKSFPGATTSHMKNHIVPCMERKPDHVVLHVGCNDVRSKDDPSAIASRIVELASDVQKENTTVTVSTLIPRNDSNELNEKTEAVNAELKQMCSQRKIDIMEHSNLDRNIHVNRNVHLSRAGTNAFVGNITRYLKN